MPFFSDTRETSARYGRYIAEFQELCQRHEVSSGTPEDFYRLAHKLAHDERFRADFCTLTRSVAQREAGRLTLTRILTIIAIAMGGQNVDATSTAGAVPVSLVVVFLAGLSNWSEDENLVPADSEPIMKAAPQAVTVSEGQVLLDDEREALELERRLAAEPNDVQGVTASLFGSPSTVKEALSRLELHTLELKLHLDSIDSRMERIEPHLDDLTSHLSPVAARRTEDRRIRTHLPVIRYSQPALHMASGTELPAPSKPKPTADLPATAPSKPQHAPSKPQPAPSKSQVAPSKSQVAPSSPARELKEAYELRRLHRLLSALAVLLVVMASVLGFLLYNNYGRLMKSEIGRILVGAIGGASAKTMSLASTASGAESLTSPEAAKTEAPAPRKIGLVPPAAVRQKPQSLPTSKVVLPSGRGESAKKINVEKATEEPPRTSTIHLADALPVAIAARSSDGFSARPADRSESAESTAVSAPSSAAGDKGTAATPARTKVFVPASALVRTAIVSPPPIYPSTARMSGVEGEVVLQALISEKGTVESVSVVSGPAPLQNAAVDALRRWRFKPYQLDGHPVAVRTFVDFRFKMNY
jgi:TonB family protein